MDDLQSQIGSKDFDTYENITAYQEAFKMFLRDYSEVCNAEEKKLLPRKMSHL